MGTGDGPFNQLFQDVLSVLVELIISISLLYGPISNSVVPSLPFLAFSIFQYLSMFGILIKYFFKKLDFK